ncbi:VOC family protein [Streptomyces sp. NBC_01589]|uniref:VOC family protein n=1 Tax=Streptomyces sp. NBC_01589 TaxID=2975886 RepID=UPI003865031D
MSWTSTSTSPPHSSRSACSFDARRAATAGTAAPTADASSDPFAGRSKKIKNRIHLCLRPETSREQEVERLLGLGATFVTDHRNPDGSGWAVLADPEGNEFCVLRSESDRAAMGS